MKWFWASAFFFALAAAAVGASDEGPAATAKTTTDDDCEAKCFRTHGKSKDDNSLKFCDRGCRLHRIVDGLENRQNDPLDGDARQASVLRNCEESCELSFPKAKLGSKPCVQGCHFEAPIAQQRRRELEHQAGEESAPGMAVIRFSPISIRRISFPQVFGFGEGEPRKEEEPFGSLFSSPSDGGDLFGSMFEGIRRQMSNAMSQMIAESQGIREEMEEQGGEGGEHRQVSGPRGHVVMFQSGPGYTKEKTIDFGPDGVKTRTHTTGGEGERFMGDDDMMSKNNPLEKFFQEDDAEVFNDENEADDDDFFEDFSLPEKKLEQEAREHRLGFADDSSSFVNGFDFKEKPHLPEPGLRSGHRIIFLSHGEVCRDSSNASWSEWVHCLHVRMGLPRWLMACSMALGIVFIIWLCFAIPQNAPKQRFIKKSRTPKNFNVQEIHQKAPPLPVKKAPGPTMTVSAITSSGPPSYSKLNNDFPPTYDEASLKVKIPAVHAKAEEKEDN